MLEVSRADLVMQHRRLGRALADELMAEADWNRLKAERDAVQMRIDAIDEGQTLDGYTCVTCAGPMTDGGASGFCCEACAELEVSL